MANQYFCKDCGDFKPWYHFPWNAQQIEDDHKYVACFKCSPDGLPRNKRFEKFFLIKRIEKLTKIAMNRDITGLREKLFDAMEKVADGSMSLDKGKALCEIAQVIINSAKVEVDFIKALGGKAQSGFMQIDESKK